MKESLVAFCCVWIKGMPTLAAWSGSRSHVGSIPSELGLKDCRAFYVKPLSFSGKRDLI